MIRIDLEGSHHKDSRRSRGALRCLHALARHSPAAAMAVQPPPQAPQRVAVARDTAFVRDTQRCVRELGAAAEACRGPRGRLQLLRAAGEPGGGGGGAVTLTTVSARLFAPLASQPSRPAAQLLVDAVIRHHAIHGDAGLLVMRMATR